MPGASNSRRVFSYGVRRAPFLVDNLPALAAVDSFGNIRKVRKLKPTDDVEAIGERLWAWLREHYPEQPRLELVRPPAPAPPSVPERTVLYRGRLIDARLISDPRSPIAKSLYLERLAKAATQRSGILRFRDDT